MNIHSIKGKRKSPIFAPVFTNKSSRGNTLMIWPFVTSRKRRKNPRDWRSFVTAQGLSRNRQCLPILGIFVKLPKLGHTLRSGPYPKQVIAFSSRLWLNHESETRTERVHRTVNRNPKVSTSGKRQKNGRRRLPLGMYSPTHTCRYVLEVIAG